MTPAVACNVSINLAMECSLEREDILEPPRPESKNRKLKSEAMSEVMGNYLMVVLLLVQQ